MTSFFERKYMRHCRGVGNGGLGDDGETKKRERRGKKNSRSLEHLATRGWWEIFSGHLELSFLSICLFFISFSHFFHVLSFIHFISTCSCFNYVSYHIIYLPMYRPISFLIATRLVLRNYYLSLSAYVMKFWSQYLLLIIRLCRRSLWCK